MVLQCDESTTEQGEETVLTELPIWGKLTMHHFGLIVSAVFGAIAIIIALGLMIQHGRHYSKPYEQKHIIRILFMIPIYATISFVSYMFYRHAIYWEVLRDCYEAFAIASFFTLLCHYVEPTLHEQKNYFRRLDPKNWVWPIPWFQKCFGGRERGCLRKPRSGLTWFNVIWIGVFQYCAIRVIFTFVAMITQLLDRYCESSLNPGFAHIWTLGFNAISVTIAMYCLIQFYVQLKDDLAEHRPFLKVCCIKLVIFFSFWQNTLISFLSSGTGGYGPIIKTSSKISYIDIKVGIPCVLLSVEMAIFAVIHIFAFPWSPYDIRKSADPSARYHGGPMGIYALLDAFNPWDIIKATARGFRWLFCGISSRKEDRSYDTYGGKTKHFSGSTYNQASKSSTMEEGTEMAPQSRRPTQPEDYEDSTSLLARPQRVSKISTSPFDGHLHSDQSSPYRVPASPAFAHSPGQHPQRGHGGEYDVPPSPIDLYPPGRMETGTIPQSQHSPFSTPPYPPVYDRAHSPLNVDTSYHSTTTTTTGAYQQTQHEDDDNFPLPAKGQLPEYRGYHR